ncbi:MAG: C45 family peptidase [Lachnospiraceae bacterium]|nr:C45 family peptidase [Lachnospiraceae bacterium]
MARSFFDHYVFEGPPRALGQQHGEALREQIRAHLQLLYDRGRRYSDMSREELLETAGRFENYIRQYTPDFFEEIQGLAEGAGIQPDEALFLQCKPEIVHLNHPGGSHFKNTAFAVGTTHTAEAKMYSALNMDMAGDFEPFTNVITLKAEGKPQVMMLLPAGMISYQGCNDRGMGVSSNYLICEGWKIGVPGYLITRLLLEQESYEEALKTITRLDFSSPRSYLICHRDGKIVGVETTPERAAIREERSGIRIHTNHYVNPQMVSSEKSSDYEYTDSQCRMKRMEELLQEYEGRIDSFAIRRFLRDHLGEPHCLCLHPDPPNHYAHTFASLIMNLTDGVMEVCMGNPCCNEYASYEFIY